MQRREYDKETKDVVTRAICEEGESTSGMAKAFGVPVKTVEKWVTAYNKDHGIYKEPSLQEKNETQLRQEVLRLQRDNAILKKTLSLLAKGKPTSMK